MDNIDPKIARRHAKTMAKFAIERRGERIGAGFIVARRGHDTGRIRHAFKPFEHPTYESARVQADKLAKANPGQKFQVWAVTGPDYFVEPSGEVAAKAVEDARAQAGEVQP